jgi:hypothetical protein
MSLGVDIEHIKIEAKRKKKARTNYVKSLKNKKEPEIDAVFIEKHNEVFNEIDCLSCGNCCRNVGPLFTDKDINRISKYMKIKPGEFTEKHLRIDEDGDFVLQTLPCVFLGEDNYCSIYEVRPKACREYPHTNMKGQKKLMKLHLKNDELCPAVNEIFNRIIDKKM